MTRYLPGDQGGIYECRGCLDSFLGVEGSESIENVFISNVVDVNALHVYQWGFGGWRKMIGYGL